MELLKSIRIALPVSVNELNQVVDAAGGIVSRSADVRLAQFVALAINKSGDTMSPPVVENAPLPA